MDLSNLLEVFPYVGEIGRRMAIDDHLWPCPYNVCSRLVFIVEAHAPLPQSHGTFLHASFDIEGSEDDSNMRVVRPGDLTATKIL